MLFLQVPRRGTGRLAGGTVASVVGRRDRDSLNPDPQALRQSQPAAPASPVALSYSFSVLVTRSPQALAHTDLPHHDSSLPLCLTLGAPNPPQGHLTTQPKAGSPAWGWSPARGLPRLSYWSPALCETNTPCRYNRTEQGAAQATPMSPFKDTLHYLGNS